MFIRPIAFVTAFALIGTTAIADTTKESSGSAHSEKHSHSHKHGHSHAHDHKHGHGHAHGNPTQAEADKLKAFASGYFEDSDVAPRPLSDWEGRWQSVYPYLQDGTLDVVMEAKAKTGTKTATEYRAYYETGYKTEIAGIDIEGDKVTFHNPAGSHSATYASDGYEILTYAKGNRGVRFIFKKVEGDAQAPAFMQFSDHIIAPMKADHYHIYLGDDRAALLSEVTHWPTFYPADLTGEGIKAEMLAH